MNKLLSRKILPSLIYIAGCGCSLSGLTSCSTDNSIQLANFESYMDDLLMDHLAETYGVKYQWYTVTEMIETKFESVYDIAVPCGYELVSLYKRGWLEKIEWDKFGIDGVSSSTDAMKLFAQPIWEAIGQMNTQFNEYLETTDFNVLDYGVPYFAQQFMFAYKGDKITKWQKIVGGTTEQPTWSDILYSISPNNPNLDSRFKDRRISMIDDAKSIFDIARIVETIEAGETPTNEMTEDSSIDRLKQTFGAITSKARSNRHTLNTDSGIVSRNLADHSNNSYIAALSWSGDALYSALGAEEFTPYSGEQFHIIKPSDASLDEIEFMVMNKKNNGTEKGDRVYKVVKDVCLDGCDAEDISEPATEEEDSPYKYWAMQNWDTVNYTPTLATIYDYVVDPDSDYWDYYDADDSARQLYTSILEMSDKTKAKSLFGRTLSPLQNSNTHWVWLEARGKL